jgi:hypothetical protein
MIFGEYIGHDAAVPVQLYRHHGRQDWTGEGDVMVANLARTMRLSGEPTHLVWWRIQSLKRLDEWEEFFRSKEGRLYTAESPVAHAVRFLRNGIYDEVIAQKELPSGLHLVELFDGDDRSAEELKRIFKERTRAAPSGKLLFVLKRLALIAPDPGCIALWTFRSYVEAEPFLRAPPSAGGLRIASAGLYRRFGEEI